MEEVNDIKENFVSNLSESLKQMVDGSMDAQHLYKNERPYFPGSSLQMKLNSRYISKVRLTLNRNHSSTRQLINSICVIPIQISSSPRKFQDQSIRMRPYFIPERSRTKSESTDTKHNDIHSYALHTAAASDLFAPQCDTMMDTSCDNMSHKYATVTNVYSTGTGTPATVKGSGLKKSKSLEDIRAKMIDGSQPSHEMEFVSSRIQKLKVHD